jgi:electron transfer flavoprotein beta subunit
VNESDDHALEQAILLKESVGGSVAVVAMDFGDVDNTLYTAVAKGADRIVKIAVDGASPPAAQAAAAMLAEAIQGLQADLVLTGCQAHDELEGSLAPRLALALRLPYVGVIRGVQPGDAPGSVRVFKEFPGAVMEQMSLRLPALVGILAASRPPRYVPVSRIRATMKMIRFDEAETHGPPAEPLVKVRRLYPPAATGRAEMIEGSEADVAKRLAAILAEKGVLK